MIRKLIRQMLTAQIFAALTVSLCLMIDSIMIGRFLGEDAIAAYGLSNPVLLIVGALASLLASGIQAACGKSLGKGLKKETDAGYSSAIAVGLSISTGIMVLVLLFASPLAKLMGAGGSGPLHAQTKDYIRGFVIGAPASMMALVLVPFLQMAGKTGLLIASVLTMTVADVGLDLMNVLYLHWGMFGMGLASALSYYLAVLVAGLYFLSKKCVFSFSWKLVTAGKTAELFRGGIPAGVGMITSVILVFVLNKILTVHGGSSAVAAYSVIMTIGNTSNCITTGIGGVSLTLAGVFYHEEDRTCLSDLIRVLCRHAVILGLSVGVLLQLIAPLFVSLFIPEASDAQTMAVLGVRLFAIGLIPCCINNALKSFYQGTERVLLTECISLLEGAILPILVALVLGLLIGPTGVWLNFGLGEILTLLCITVYAWRCNHGMPWKRNGYLLLSHQFGVSDENIMEADLHSMKDVNEAAKRAGEFCLAHGQSRLVSNRIALCVEEMAGNIIEHGFTKDTKQHHLSVRVLCKEDKWILRFRDDCSAFDPVSYVPEADKDALGIRLVLALADEANYTYSLNLNNLALKLQSGSLQNEAT